MKQLFTNVFTVLTLVIASNVLAEGDVAKVIAVKKQVFVERASIGFKAKRKTSLNESDRVLSGDNARAQIRFNDGTLTTLGANSEMTIDSFKWSKQEKNPHAEFTLVKGVFRTLTGEITRVSNPDYKVHTPVGSIGIRGTDFWGGYLEPDAIDVLFVDGEHEIVVSNEYGTTVLTQPGQGTTIRVGKAPEAAKVWSKEKVTKAVKTIQMD